LHIQKKPVQFAALAALKTHRYEKDYLLLAVYHAAFFWLYPGMYLLYNHAILPCIHALPEKRALERTGIDSKWDRWVACLAHCKRMLPSFGYEYCTEESNGCEPGDAEGGKLWNIHINRHFAF
jgi:hypothetical protein